VILELAERHGVEQIIFCSDSSVGLKAVIVIHDSTFGPAAGGTRLMAYPSEAAALEDAIRLATGMTRKCTLARTGTGGAKAVIMASPEQKTEAMLRSYGRFVERLGGAFLTGNDVNTGRQDMEILAEETQYILGLSEQMGPSAPVTARGVFSGIRSCLETVYGDADLNGRTVAIQGMGSVGYELGKAIHSAGGQLVVTDIDPAACQRAEREFGASVVSGEAIYGCQADVFAPCALGAVLNPDTVPLLNCRIVCGSANNQLLTEEDGDALFTKGILYAPDYVVNAGGAIYVRIQRENPETPREDVLKGAEEIYDTMTQVLNESERRQQPPHRVANQIADERLQEAKRGETAYA
jgi:leucine dehydrogenase